MIMTKNYKTNVDAPRKLAILDLDDCLISAQFAFRFLEVLEKEGIIEKGTYGKIQKDYQRYAKSPTKENYETIIRLVIDSTGHILENKEIGLVRALGWAYSKGEIEPYPGNKSYWLPYTQGLIGLLDGHRYGKASITAMPEELAHPVSKDLWINEKLVCATSYQTHKGKYNGKTQNSYASNGSKTKKVNKIIDEFHDAGLKERTLIIDNSVYGPFSAGKYGMLVNSYGKLPNNLQKMKNEGNLLVCRPEDDVIKMATPFLRKVDKEILTY
jgi:hypothetical protein